MLKSSMEQCDYWSDSRALFYVRKQCVLPKGHKGNHTYKIVQESIK